MERKRRQDKILQRLEQIERDKAKQREEQAKPWAKQERIQTAKEISELNATVVKLAADNKELLEKHGVMECQISEVTHLNSKMEGKVDALSLRVLSERNLDNDDSKVKYFTGLPTFRF